MNCPKCNSVIDDKMLVCPNCKKVLKLVCPKCKTANQSNLCKKCGFTIIVKCHGCGKINQTINKKCNKCGLSTYSSVAINTSNTDDFASLIITFPNIEDIKSALGSTKLFEKFRLNLDQLVFDSAREQGLNREVIDGAYIIKFSKDSSFEESASSAIKGSIDLLNAVTELNSKLHKLKNILLQCNVAVLKRSIHSMPDDFKSGFDIKIIYQGKNKSKLLNGLQVVTDAGIYEQTCDNFALSPLSSAFVNGKTVMFFELDIKKYVKIPTPKEDEQAPTLSNLPTYHEDLAVENDLYSIDSINFDELNVCFIKTDSADVTAQVLNKLQENPVNLITIKSGNEHAPITNKLFDQISKLGRFENVFRVTCDEKMKYEPYGFFRELISSICDFSLSPKNFAINDFSMFEAIDPSNYIRNLINLHMRENAEQSEVRNILFDIFFNVLSSLSGSLLYIEDLDYIDNSSYEFLQLFFEKLEEFNLSYVATTSKDFSLHKDAHFLLSNRFYTNITVGPTPFRDIISKDLKKYGEILNSYCVEKIANNFKGSSFYFNQAIYYLTENNCLVLNDDGGLTLASQESIFIPTTLEALISKRLKVLSKDKTAFDLLSKLLILGPRIDVETINFLEIKDETLEIRKLIERGYVSLNNRSLYINNYNQYKNGLLSILDDEQMQAVANELLTKIFTKETACATKIELLRILNLKKEEITNLEKLSLINNSLSDFNAYLNCSDILLQLIEEPSDEALEKAEDEYKAGIYDNISTLLHKFSPDKAHKITQMILNNLEKSTDNEKTVKLCNKMLQGCLVDGTYAYAHELINKILSRFSNASINPESERFNLASFFISLIKIEVLFSVGNHKDCVELGEEILDALSKENIQRIKPEHLTLEQFEEILYETMTFIALSKIILLSNGLTEFIAKINTNIGQPPRFFKLLLTLEQLIKGINIELPNDVEIGNDKFSKILLNLTKAFSIDKNDYKKFADDCHQAKISAKLKRLNQIELFCDLLIGYSYFKLNQYKKASAIYNNILETSTKNGLKTIVYLDCYFIALLELNQQNFEIAEGTTNNSIIQLEKNNNSGDFLLFIFKTLLAQILASKGEIATANLCLNNANFIQQKHGLKYKTKDFKDINEQTTVET